MTKSLSLLTLSRAFTSIFLHRLPRRRMPFYAVARGHSPGIYSSWTECQQQIVNFRCPRFKKFATESEAQEFIQENAASNPVVDRRAESSKTPAAEEGNDAGKSTATCSVDNNRLSPALQEMKREMKRLQKEIAQLRSKFEEYVTRSFDANGTSQRQSSHDYSSTAEKRKLEEEDCGVDRKSVTKKLNTGGSSDDKTKFATDIEGFLIVYTDGSCEFNGRHGAKAGVGVYFGPDHPLNVSEPVKGRATNNTAEIQAATYALELARTSGFTKVAVHTDSQFMINCMTSWLKKWKQNNWCKSDGEPVKNKEDLISLDAASEGLAVKWVHVKGHAGHEGNEIADKLARQGAKSYIGKPETDDC